MAAVLVMLPPLLEIAPVSGAAGTSPSPRAELLERLRRDIPASDAARELPRRPGQEHARRQSWESLGGNIVGPVSVVLRSRGRSIFVRDASNTVHHRRAMGEYDWQPWENLGGNITSAVGVDTLSDRENLDLAVRGADGKVWHKAHGFGEPWQKVGDLSIQGTPVIRHYANLDAVIFARAADNTVWAVQQVDTVWQDWAPLGGDIASDLDIAWSADTPMLFGRGAGDQLMSLPLDAAQPVWTSLGQAMRSGPSVTLPDPARTDVAVRATDDSVRYRTFANGAWQSWRSMGGRTFDQPVVDWFYLPQLIISFMVRGTDGHLWTRQFQPGTGEAGPWFDDGGRITTRPTPLTFNDGSGTAHEVYARGTDGAVWHAWA